MTSTRRMERDEVFAIIRWDGFQGPSWIHIMRGKRFAIHEIQKATGVSTSSVTRPIVICQFFRAALTQEAK